MKKFLFLLSCLLICLVSNIGVLAEDIKSGVSNTDAENRTLSTNNNGGQADLVSVYFSFCNNGVDDPTDSLNAAVELGKPFRVCLMIYNVDKENDAYLDLSFIAGGKNEAGYNVCGLQSLDDFITSGSLGQITVPADNYLIKEFEVTFPFGYDGEQNTCIGVSSVEKDSEMVGGLKILSRKVYYATFFVGGGDGLKNLLNVTDLQTRTDENKNLILSFNVKNDGNMENSYDIQGNIRGLFNFQREFVAEGGRVIPGHSEYVEIPLGELPSYGGLFKINLKISGTPYFSYDISNAKIDPAMLEPKSFEFTTKYFKMPWLICGIALFFIILIILLFRRPKQKVIYVQQPQQPVQPQQPINPNQQ